MTTIAETGLRNGTLPAYRSARHHPGRGLSSALAGGDGNSGVIPGADGAAEIVETLALLTEWLSGSQEKALADSFTAFIGHPAHNTGALCADLHRFAFLLGASDGEELFGEPTVPAGSQGSVTAAPR